MDLSNYPGIFARILFLLKISMAVHFKKIESFNDRKINKSGSSLNR
jgi:hypothetical protein